MLILVYMSILQCYISCSGLPMLLEEHYSCSPGVYFCWQFITMTEQLKCLLYCAFCLFLFVGRSGRWRCVSHTNPADKLLPRNQVFGFQKWQMTSGWLLLSLKNRILKSCRADGSLLQPTWWNIALNYIPAVLNSKQMLTS